MAKFFDIHSTLKQTVSPALEPLTPEDAKLHCRVDGNEQDSLFVGLISSARAYCEAYLKRQLLTATWTLTLDDFPSDEILLRVCPVSSVSSITYLDSAGDSQTFSSSYYRVDSTSEPARITPAWGQSWPSTRGVISQVTVTFVAGYGGPVAVPAAIKQAMLMLIGHGYYNPNAVLQGTFTEVPLGVTAWLNSHAWSRVH